MGNRISRKNKQQAAADPARNDEVASTSSAPATLTSSAALPEPPPSPGTGQALSFADDKDCSPLPPRQAPPTARDVDPNTHENALAFFQHCYQVEEDPYTLYNQALVLKQQHEFAAASNLLRTITTTESLSLEAHHHLAQCLLAQDLTLRSCREEVTRCLEHVVATAKPLSNAADASYFVMYRESLELLAHVLIAGRHFDRALKLLDSLNEFDSGRMLQPEQTASRQQQTLVCFQRAFCRFARGDSPDAVDSELRRVLQKSSRPTAAEEDGEEEKPLSGIELLLCADAVGIRQGLEQLTA